MNRKKYGVWKILLVEVLVIIIGLMIAMYMTLNNMNQFNLLIDLPTILLILLFAVPAFLVSGLRRDFMIVFKLHKTRFSISQLRRCMEAVMLMQRLILIAGLFSVFIALITCLTHVSDLEILGLNIAVICLSGLYTAILEFLLLPLKTFVQVALIEEMEMDNEEK